MPEARFSGSKHFHTTEECERFLAKVKSALEFLEHEFNTNVWITIEQVYATRYDCSLARA